METTGLATFIQASAHSLPMIADGSVQCICTSPPYFGLRSYQGEQAVEWPSVTFRLNEWVEPVTVEPMLCGLGTEPSPVAYLAHLILCLREWRRVLRDDGTVWVNLGDSYAGGGGYWPDAPSNQNGRSLQSGGNQNGQRNIKGRAASSSGVAPKNLLMVPAMFAIAARADGWFLRSDIVWAKPNPMPESVTDRPTKAHEYVFLLAKSARYFWDSAAVAEPAENAGRVLDYTGAQKNNGTDPVLQATRPKGRMITVAPTRNLRTVWNVSTSPFAGAHFACWPEKLVEPMVKAGTSERGACPQCGKPWERVTEREGYNGAGRADNTVYTGQAYSSPQSAPRGPARNFGEPIVWSLGFRPACTCPAHEPVPCVVLDPFSGSGTTAKVAVRLGRRAIGVDVSAEYLGDVTAQRFGEGVQMEMAL